MSVTTWQKLAASVLSAFTPSLPSTPPNVNGCQLSLVLNAQATVCVLQTIKPGKASAGARGPFKFNMHIQKKVKNGLAAHQKKKPEGQRRYSEETHNMLEMWHTE